MDIIANYGNVLIILAIVFGTFMAWGIGANDVANAMGTSVGSGAVTIKQAIIIAVIFEFSGAILAGGEVTATIRKGILDAALFTNDPHLLVYGMMASLLAAGSWLLIASSFGWPVSTTHSIVGAIVGFGAVGVGVDAVAWGKVIKIVISWIASPVLAGIVSFALFRSLQNLIIDTQDPFNNAKKYVPYYMFLVGFVVSLVTIFKGLKHVGLSFSTSTSYLLSLGFGLLVAIIGTLMLVQGITEIDRERRKIIIREKLHAHYWIHGLPLRMRFPKSKLYESIFTPIIIGLIVGFIAAIMGIGGAFILVPAMIYIIKMPTKLVPGTSLFVTIFVSAIVTVLHALYYGSIDLILVSVLIFGSILGVQLGQKLGEKVDSSEFKTILAILLMLVGIAIAYDTFFTEEIVKNHLNNGTKTLGPISLFVRELSNNVPFIYGMFSIVLAIAWGIGGAAIRRFFSNLRKQRLKQTSRS